MNYTEIKLIHIYPYATKILKEISQFFCFDFHKTGEIFNSFNKLQYCFHLSDLCFTHKADIDDYIINGNEGNEYERAKILYALYTCNYLRVDDIEYPTYEDWQIRNYSMTLDHKLPKRWFPRWTFDCSNWQAIPNQENKEKGDDFLEIGAEKIEELFSVIKDIKLKYM